jgi:hypothetical protein
MSYEHEETLLLKKIVSIFASTAVGTTISILSFNSLIFLMAIVFNISSTWNMFCYMLFSMLIQSIVLYLYGWCVLPGHTKNSYWFIEFSALLTRICMGSALVSLIVSIAVFIAPVLDSVSQLLSLPVLLSISLASSFAFTFNLAALINTNKSFASMMRCSDRLHYIRSNPWNNSSCKNTYNYE